MATQVSYKPLNCDDPLTVLGAWEPEVLGQLAPHLVRLKGDYPLCASSSVASVCWVAAHDARSAKLSAVGVPAGAV